MLGWLWTRFGQKTKKPSESRGSDAGERVRFDDISIAVPRTNGLVEILAWADLASVTILTSEAGPVEPDLFWVLQNRDGRRRLVVPMGAAGEHELLKAMQARLHGFDNMAVIEAMGSTGNASFVIWEHAKRDPSSSS
jgi:hypothetical protein